MLCSLFSQFDPCYSGNGMNWILIVFVFVMIGWSVFTLSSVWNNVGNSSSLLVNPYLNGNNGSLLLFALFVLTSVLSLLGLIPFCFTLTSQPSVSISLSLPLWLGFLLYSLLLRSVSVVSHLLPIGSPLILSPFLVLVESVSLVIRPFSLAIRMSANMVAGHLILTIVVGVGSLVFESIGVLVLGFESVVSIIQSVVFVSLICLYWSESE